MILFLVNSLIFLSEKSQEVCVRDMGFYMNQGEDIQE